ncbi:MAG TPA: aldo/keto reductase [Chthoniobacterales bacterium]|nr:aldo/keto reductase [Chthoniobacterales bacterium]
MPEITKRVPPGIRPIQRDRAETPFAAEADRYARMPYRRCGSWGLKLPAIALGAWETFGGYRGPEIARQCLFGAFNLGINHFDLANNYGQPPGQAETVVGRIVADMPRDELIISTKAGFYMWPGPYGQGSSRKYLMASLDQSLRRLGLDYVDIFYSHRHDPETPLEETLGALDQIVRSGKALYAGLSNYSGKQLEEAVGLTRHHNLAPILVEQSSYSLLNRRVETDLLPSVSHARTGVVAFSPLAQGLLSEKYLEGFPEGSRAAKIWNQEQREKITPLLREAVRKLVEIAKNRGQTLPQMAIAWILRRPEITTVLIGASSMDQIAENVRALEKLQFSPEELQQIDAITVPH